ncbi:MAG: coenzyme F420-0:L-glutamate ligase [Bdellovibrionota bacterium]
MSSLHVHPVETAIFPEGGNLAEFVHAQVPANLVKERMILAITSKIVSLSEKRLVSPKEIDKAALIEREADIFIGEVGYGCYLTVKEGLFIPSSGIDESNSASGDFILYPADPYESARRLWAALRELWSLQELGILLTDSHTSPLRKGVTGVCLSHWGFGGVRNMIGTKDLFGRELMMTKMNLADGLSAAAVLMMGEGAERRPLAVLEGANCEFHDMVDANELRMPPKDDLYYPFFKQFF